MGRGSDVFLHRYRELSSHHPSDSRTWWRLDQLGCGPVYHVLGLTPESQTGPLLWHFEENTISDPSIKLDLEEVKTLAAHICFEIKVRHLISAVRSSRLRFCSCTERTHNRYDLCQ